MSPPEPKLKRSPYLSQMTRTTNMDIAGAATLGLSRGTGANGVGGSGGEAGAASDFFELKRPEMAQHSAGRQLQLRPSLKKPSSTTMKKETSVTFAANHSSRSTPVSADFLNGTSSNADAIPQQHKQLRMQHPPASSKPYRSNTTTPNLQYYYNPAMKCSALSFDLIKNKAKVASSWTMTFRDVLDEGDGKEGDLNLRQRNEQWKTFAETSLEEEVEVSTPSSESRKKRKQPSPYLRGGWVSANDLMVMRRAASRIKMSTHLDEFALCSKANSNKDDLWKGLGETLGSTMLSRITQEANVSASRERYISAGAQTRNTPVVTSEECLVQSLLLRRVHTMSAGLAYGSNNFRILNECKNNEILEV